MVILLNKLAEFSPVHKPQSLKEIAYSTLKDAILTLQLEPGHALSHRDLAAQLHISETPIRDALQELEREGFVTRIPHKGTFVTQVDLADIEETFQIRSALEGLAVRLVVGRLDADDFEALRAILDEAQVALADEERVRCSELGAKFHQYFIERAENRRLRTLLGNLDDHLKRFRRLSDMIHGRLEKSQHEHEALLKVVMQGQSEAAGRAMSEHLDSVLADIRLYGQTSVQLN